LDDGSQHRPGESKSILDFAGLLIFTLCAFVIQWSFFSVTSRHFSPEKPFVPNQVTSSSIAMLIQDTKSASPLWITCGNSDSQITLGTVLLSSQKPAGIPSKHDISHFLSLCYKNTRGRTIKKYEYVNDTAARSRFRMLIVFMKSE